MRGWTSALLLACACASACSFEVGAHAIAGDDVPPPDAPDGGGAVCGHANWRDPAWSSRYPMAVQAAHVSGSPGDMAVLVAFTSAELTHAKADGSDILFTASDGTSPLPFEIERFDPSAGALIAWVRFVSISSAANTNFYLYFGNAAPPALTPQAVWGNYLGVWHLREDPGTAGTQIHDSSGNGNDLSTQGMTTADRVTGKIGSGFQFDGMNNGVSRGTFALPAQFTYEAWAKPSLVSGFHVVFDSNNYDRWFGFNGPDIDYYNGADHFAMQTLSVGGWHHIAAVVDGAHVQMYLDGAPAGPQYTTTTAAETAGVHGGFSNAGEWFNGTLDELRVSSAALTHDQLATRFENQGAPDRFVVPGTIEHCTP